MEQRIVNLTPHPLVLEIEDKRGTEGVILRTIDSSGIARCESTETEIGTFAGLPIVRTTFGAVVGLPAPEPGVAYVVSSITAQAVEAASSWDGDVHYGRDDVYVPARPVRDGQGRIVACRALGRI